MNFTAKGRNRKKDFVCVCAKDWAGSRPFSSYNNNKKAFVGFQTCKSKRLHQTKMEGGNSLHHWPSTCIPKLAFRLRSSNPSTKQRELKRLDLKRPQEMRLAITLHTELVKGLGEVEMKRKGWKIIHRICMKRKTETSWSIFLISPSSMDVLSAQFRLPGAAWIWVEAGHPCLWISSLNCISVSDRDAAYDLIPRSRLFLMFY